MIIGYYNKEQLHSTLLSCSDIIMPTLQDSSVSSLNDCPNTRLALLHNQFLSNLNKFRYRDILLLNLNTVELRNDGLIHCNFAIDDSGNIIKPRNLKNITKDLVEQYIVDSTL